MDRLRGAHHTPANAPIFDAVSVEPQAAPTANPGTLFDQGVNLLRAVPGRGVAVWGGRTLRKHGDENTSEPPIFLAHRRLTHRMVRAMRPARPSPDRKSTRLNSSHRPLSRMPSSA